MYAVIMAGGTGTRFWPRSREEKPKQFLSILDSKTLIQMTIERLTPLIDKKHIFLVMNPQQQTQLLAQLPDFIPEQIILEPFGKNTAPCIGLAAIHLQVLHPDSVMVVLPSDHIIRDVKTFHQALQIGEEMAIKSDAMITIGITPNRPATGYGYIQHSEKALHSDGISVYKVKTFAEKPIFETAKLFLKSGDFLWNSGIFIWKTATILREIRSHLPELYIGLEKLQKTIGKVNYPKQLERFYRQIRSISIDYGVMEDAQNVYVIKCDLGWNDVGSWDEVYKLSEKDKNGNAIIGNGMIVDGEDNLIYSKDDLVAVLGVKDMVVVKSENAILVCPRERAQDVKDLVDMLKRKNMNEYL